jgi:hypothetical protein
MHPRTQHLTRELPDFFNTRVERDGRVVVSYRRRCLAIYDPCRDHICIQLGLLVQVDEDGSRVAADLGQLAELLVELDQKRIRAVGYRIEGANPPDEFIHVLRLEGMGVRPAFVQAVIIMAWAWSLPAIEWSCRGRVSFCESRA